ncbi:HNH endonuclease signature motif containing protein [Leucobacter chromiisoli]
MRRAGRSSPQRAHRVAYEFTHGENPERHVDHICRVRACVNPDHLRDVSNAENVLGGIGPTAINARKKRCNRGHEFDAVDSRGWRSCTTCRNEKRRERRAKQRAALPVGGETDDE